MRNVLFRSFASVIAAFMLLAITAQPVTVAGENGRLVILRSQETALYKEVLTGLRQYVSQYGVTISEEYSLQGDPTETTQILQAIRRDHSQVLLTVGSSAAQAVLKEGSENPLIACLVVNADELRKARNATGVIVDFPLETQFQWMQRFLPENKTTGVLFNPKENRDKIEAATKVARSLGIRLIPREVETPQALPDALDVLARDVDVLWGVTDQTVLSPQTAEPILLFSFRNRIPFAGLSTPWVKAGALYALDRDYTDLGAQCGEMALKVLQGTRASSLLPAFPRKVKYALNLKTAQHMKLAISQTLIDGAQQVFQ